MSDVPKAELLRSLGKVVRGLSALFWTLPLALIAYIQTARTDWLSFFGAFGMLPPVVLSGAVCLGLLQLRDFQKQERIWQQALNRAEVFSLVNFGMTPFLFWWHRLPYVPLYRVCIGVLILSSLLFLIQLNRVLQRLAAMLPDEMLRSETRLFSGFNIVIFSGILVVIGGYVGLAEMKSLPVFLHRWVLLVGTEGLWMSLFLVMMPLAMTMAIIWKIKEVIFSSVFNAEN